jgi:hypothetical protein
MSRWPLCFHSSNWFVRFVAGLLVGVSVGSVFSAQQVEAQNLQRLEEEAEKDKERELKLQEYLRNREAEEKAILSEPITAEELKNRNLVEVEPSNILPSDLANVYALVPYRVRRPRWSSLINFTYSQFHPVNFVSDYTPAVAEDFETLYGKEAMLEISYAYKYNFLLGSLGGEVGVSTYSNEADSSDMGDAKLDLKLARMGFRYIADNLFHEPRFAPYAFGGAYTAFFKETQANRTFDGSTGVAYYYGAGVLLQLGWLDPSAALDAYTESGIENTFVFLEMRKHTAAAGDEDPDFSTDLDLNAGLTLEF